MNIFTLSIDGMKCGMCESHVNDVVRKSARVKSVTSSHTKGETVIIADNNIDIEAIKTAIKDEGYYVTNITQEEYRKEGFFARFKK